MVIKGTNKIKGVLDLSSVGLQLKKGAVYSISDNDYWNSDVQAAIKMGFLASAGDPSRPSSGNEPNVVRCVNSFHRPITLKAVDGGKEVMPNHSFILPESKLNDPDIKVAISKGMITVTQVINSNDHSEGFLELGNLFAKESAKKKAQQEQEAIMFKKKTKEAASRQPKNELGNENNLETNEEISSFGEVIEDEKIVWNPSGSKKGSSKKVVTSLKDAIRTTRGNDDRTEILKAREEIDGPHTGNVINDPNPAPVQAADDPKRQTIVVNPHKSKVTNTAKSYVWNSEDQKIDQPDRQMTNEQIDEILFVDEKQEQEKIASHPILSKKQVEIEIEDDPIAPDSIDANRIAKHPVLSKKQNEEINFVE